MRKFVLTYPLLAYLITGLSIRGEPSLNAAGKKFRKRRALTDPVLRVRPVSFGSFARPFLTLRVSNRARNFVTSFPSTLVVLQGHCISLVSTPEE